MFRCSMSASRRMSYIFFRQGYIRTIKSEVSNQQTGYQNPVRVCANAYRGCQLTASEISFRGVDNKCYQEYRKNTNPNNIHHNRVHAPQTGQVAFFVGNSEDGRVQINICYPHFSKLKTMLAKLLEFHLGDLKKLRSKGHISSREALIIDEEESSNSFLVYKDHDNRVTVKYHKFNLKLKIILAYLFFLILITIPVVFSSILDGQYLRIGVLLLMIVLGLALVLLDRSRSKKRIKKYLINL